MSSVVRMKQLEPAAAVVAVAAAVAPSPSEQ
jgi:hypothetical protein